MKWLPSGYKQRAEKLAVQFLDETSIPIRLKSTNKSTVNYRKDSKIELEFQETVNSWVYLMEKLMERGMRDDLIHRFIYLQVNLVGPLSSISEYEDWRDLNEYMSYIQDPEVGSEMELWRFSMLFGAFQRVLEGKLKRTGGLKDELAQELLENGQVTIDGHVIKLWRGHTSDNVSIQQNWNKIQSLGALNLNKPKDSHRIVLTGIFQISRAEVASYASDMGFIVQAKPNSLTNIVVFGSENVSPTKIADVINLRRNGHNVELMEENAFLEMVLAGQV